RIDSALVAIREHSLQPGGSHLSELHDRYVSFRYRSRALPRLMQTSRASALRPERPCVDLDYVTALPFESQTAAATLKDYYVRQIERLRIRVMWFHRSSAGCS